MGIGRLYVYLYLYLASEFGIDHRPVFVINTVLIAMKRLRLEWDGAAFIERIHSNPTLNPNFTKTGEIILKVCQQVCKMIEAGTVRPFGETHKAGIWNVWLEYVPIPSREAH